MNNYLDKLFTNVWSDLVRASHDGKHPFRYPSLATYSAETGVSQRTVVLRKVFTVEKELLFYSDIRTQKVKDLSFSSQAAVLFYHPRQRVQLRLNCHVRIIEENTEKEHYWKNLNEAQKKDYASEQASGISIISKEEITYYKDIEMGINNFCLLLGSIKSIDYLQLNREQHERVIYQKNEQGEWFSKPLIP